MRRIRAERGEGKIGCIFWSLVTLVFALFAFEMVPVKIATMQLEDHMKELAMTQPWKPREFFEREIFNKSRALKLDVPRKQIRVKKFSERVIMDVEFTVPVEVLTFNWDWEIKIHVDRDLFLM